MKIRKYYVRTLEASRSRVYLFVYLDVLAVLQQYRQSTFPVWGSAGFFVYIYLACCAFVLQHGQHRCSHLLLHSQRTISKCPFAAASSQKNVSNRNKQSIHTHVSTSSNMYRGQLLGLGACVYVLGSPLRAVSPFWGDACFKLAQVISVEDHAININKTLSDMANKCINLENTLIHA